MKEKTIICQKCGKEVVIRATFAKYCDDCRVIAIKESHKRYRVHRSQTVAVKRSDDTEEMRQCCLNCTKAKCYGECEELAAISRRVEK